jgi:hypothetical protein
LHATRERLETDIRALPKRVPVRATMDTEPIVQLERERKIITDTFKMVACRAETQLANLAGPCSRTGRTKHGSSSARSSNYPRISSRTTSRESSACASTA